MDSNTFINEIVFDNLHDDYFNSDLDWCEFVESKDLGIDCLDWKNDVYIITDEKKWLINKIKYGI